MVQPLVRYVVRTPRAVTNTLRDARRRKPQHDALDRSWPGPVIVDKELAVDAPADPMVAGCHDPGRRSARRGSRSLGCRGGPDRSTVPPGGLISRGRDHLRDRARAAGLSTATSFASITKRPPGARWRAALRKHAACSAWVGRLPMLSVPRPPCGPRAARRPRNACTPVSVRRPRCVWPGEVLDRGLECGNDIGDWSNVGFIHRPAMSLSQPIRARVGHLGDQYRR